MNTTLPKSVMALLEKGARETFSRFDDGSFSCKSLSGNDHVLRGDCPVPAPACECYRGEAGAVCHHQTLLRGLQALCQPGEALTWGEVGICAECHQPHYWATCTPAGTMAGIRRVKCGCLQGETRVK